MIRGQLISLLAVCALAVCAVLAFAVPVHVPIVLQVAAVVSLAVALVFLARWTYVANYRRQWAEHIAGRSPPDNMSSPRQGSATAA